MNVQQLKKQLVELEGDAIVVTCSMAGQSFEDRQQLLREAKASGVCAAKGFAMIGEAEPTEIRIVNSLGRVMRTHPIVWDRG